MGWAPPRSIAAGDYPTEERFREVPRLVCRDRPHVRSYRSPPYPPAFPTHGDGRIVVVGGGGFLKVKVGSAYTVPTKEPLRSSAYATNAHRSQTTVATSSRSPTLNVPPTKLRSSVGAGQDNAQDQNAPDISNVSVISVTIRPRAWCHSASAWSSVCHGGIFLSLVDMTQKTSSGG